MQQSAKTRLRQAMGWIAWAGNAAYTPPKNMSIIETFQAQFLLYVSSVHETILPSAYLYYPINTNI
jgi:hypothetical protein